MGVFPSPNLSPSLGGLVTDSLALPAGGTWLFPGTEKIWRAKPGRNTAVQQLDPISGFWRTIGSSNITTDWVTVPADGQNYRLANQTGCAVGALLTTAGSGYTSAPLVTPSAGKSVWRAIVGGAVNTTVTIVNGGTNYAYPPIVLIAPPPVGGVPAAGVATLTSGAVSAITITDQGAGYVTPPAVALLNDPREGLNGTTVGSGAVVSTALTGAGTVTAVVCVDHGTPLTAVPSLSFSGGGGSSAAATAIMCWTITAYAVTGGGTGYSGNVIVTPYDVFPATSPAYTNPSIQSGLVKTRQGLIVAALAAGVITATGQTVIDGGIYTTATPGQMTQYNTPPTTAAALTFTMGGVTDVSEVYPI